MDFVRLQIIGILEGAFLMLMLLAGWRLYVRFGRSKKMTLEEIKKNGVLAEAIVLDVQETGLYINNLPQIKLQIQVQPEKGRNFITEVQQVIPGAVKEPLHSGSRVQVKFDPGNKKEVIVFRILS
jgi:hypothetical protein